MRPKRVCLFLLCALFVACNALPGQKGPSGALGDVARSAADFLSPSASATDPRFDDFIALVDVKKDYPDLANEIATQIKAGREAVTKRSSSSMAGRLASVRGVLGESIVFEFANLLASSLDEFTKQSGTHEFPKLPPTAQTSDGADTVTTSSRSETATLKSNGPQVTLTIVWTYQETTKNKQTGATLVQMSEDRTMTGAINVCPDDQGGVGAFVDVNGKFAASLNGRSVTLSMSNSTVFTGYVNDGAALTRVHHVLQDKQEWHGTDGDGNYDLTFAADSAADGAGSFATADLGNVSGDVAASDAAALTRATKLGGMSIALNDHSLDSAFQQAQRLWKNGRCVVIAASDYKVETPIEVGDQTKSQHDEGVDISSETKFAVDIKFRYGGIVKAPITASLSGQKSLTPDRVDSAPSQLTFKAPDEDDKKSTATLRSISKRGIGTLVLDFHTGGALTLSIDGELSGNSQSIGTVRTLDIVKIGPLEFKKWIGDLWQATGKWKAETSSFTTVAGSSDTCTGTESGTLTLTASQETRGNQRVWVIDPADIEVDGKGTTTCTSSLGSQTLRGVTIPGTRTFDSDGDSAELFMSHLDPFEIPAGGGTVHVQGSSGGSGGSHTANGTATAKK